MVKFCFDLDGIIFKGESLPYIAKSFGLWDQYLYAAQSDNEESECKIDKENLKAGLKEKATDNYPSNSNKKSIKESTGIREREEREGTDEDNQEVRIYTGRAYKSLKDFKKNLLKRIDVLRQIPILQVVGALNTFPLNEQIVDFIKKRPNSCAVITSNLDCWVAPVLESLGCEYHTSKALIRGGNIQSVDIILDKASIVEQYRSRAFDVVFIGNAWSDINAMKASDASVAFLASEGSYQGLENICDYCHYDQKSLIELLNDLE